MRILERRHSRIRGFEDPRNLFSYGAGVSRAVSHQSSVSQVPPVMGAVGSSLFTTGHFFSGYNAHFRTFGLQLSPHNSTHLTTFTTQLNSPYNSHLITHTLQVALQLKAHRLSEIHVKSRKRRTVEKGRSDIGRLTQKETREHHFGG